MTNKTPVLGLKLDGVIGHGGMSLFGRDMDALTVAKSTYTTRAKNYNKLEELVINKNNIVKDKEVLN